MSGEAWGAVLGLSVYFGMKAIDRLFRIVDHALDHAIDDHDDQEDTDEDR